MRPYRQDRKYVEWTKKRTPRKQGDIHNRHDCACTFFGHDACVVVLRTALKLFGIQNWRSKLSIESGATLIERWGDSVCRSEGEQFVCLCTQMISTWTNLGCFPHISWPWAKGVGSRENPTGKKKNARLCDFVLWITNDNKWSNTNMLILWSSVHTHTHAHMLNM